MRLLLLLLFASSAAAEVQVGVSHGTPDSERLKTYTGYTINVGGEGYVWGSYENMDVQLVGQNLGDVDLWGAGLGVRGPWGAFAEFGYFVSDESTVDLIRNEAVVTALENHHGEIPFHPKHTVYRLGNGYGGRLGASYELWDDVLLTAAYRVLKLNEGYDACTGKDPSCDFPVDGRHWQDRVTLQFKGFEFGMRVRF